MNFVTENGKYLEQESKAWGNCRRGAPLTRSLTKEPGCEGSRLILLRLMSKISRDGITVNCAKQVEEERH